MGRRILLIEDDRAINEANQIALELEGYEVCTARTMKAGVNRCEEFHPDLILLDIVLPDANALDYGAQLKNSYGVNILYLSGLNTKEDVIRGLRSGGDDYMTKPYMMEELLLRVASLLRRKEQPPIQEDFATGRMTWHVAAKQIELDGEELQLQPKEYAVLEYLQRNQARYVSTKELARKIWLTEDEMLVSKAIRNAISGTRKKLEGSGCSIEQKRGEGYRFLSACDP